MSWSTAVMMRTVVPCGRRGTEASLAPAWWSRRDGKMDRMSVRPGWVRRDGRSVLPWWVNKQSRREGKKYWRRYWKRVWPWQEEGWEEEWEKEFEEGKEER